jgi:hypothetical protein
MLRSRRKDKSKLIGKPASNQEEKTMCKTTRIVGIIEGEIGVIFGQVMVAIGLFLFFFYQGSLPDSLVKGLALLVTLTALIPLSLGLLGVVGSVLLGVKRSCTLGALQLVTGTGSAMVAIYLLLCSAFSPFLLIIVLWILLLLTSAFFATCGADDLEVSLKLQKTALISRFSGAY